MRPYKSSLKEISYFLLIAILTSCASIMKSTQYPVATALVVSANGKLGIIQDNDVNKSKVFDSYCSGSRQIKELTINFTYYAPSKPKGQPLNTVSKLMSEISKKQQCDQRTILFSMSQMPACDVQGQQVCRFNYRGDLFFNSTVEDSSFIENLKQTAPSTGHNPYYRGGYGGYPSAQYFLIKDSSGKLSLFNYFAFDSVSKEIYSKAPEILGAEVKSAYLADLNSLVSDYTMLEPLDFQVTTYFDEIEKNDEIDTCDLKDEYRADYLVVNKYERPVEAFGIDGSGDIDIAKSIQDQSRIWKRYISRFSTIKESSVSSGVKNVQVSLDLNNFCRYGRSLDDVTSK